MSNSRPRYLIVRLGSLGDLVHTLPAVAAIRRAHPEAGIDWLVDAPHADFLRLVPVLSDVVVLENRKVRGWLAARRELRKRQYDLAIDFQGLLKSAALARLSGARQVIGFGVAGLREPAAAPFYNRRVGVGEGRHVIHKNLRLAASVGASAGAVEFPIRVGPSAVDTWLAAQGLGRFVMLNPCAAWPNKRWPPQAFGRLADALHQRYGLRSVILWGPDEAGLAAAVVDASNGAAVTAPETRLPDVVALTRAAALFVSGDTGPLHIAAAVGTPVVGLFGPTDPRRNGPWNAHDAVVTRYGLCTCHYQRQCGQPETWCLAAIAVSDVLDAIEDRMGRRLQGPGARET